MRRIVLETTPKKHFSTILKHCIFSVQVTVCLALAGCSKSSGNAVSAQEQKEKVGNNYDTGPDHQPEYQENKPGDDDVVEQSSTNEATFGNSTEENLDPNCSERKNNKRTAIVASILRRSNRSGLPMEQLGDEEKRYRAKQMIHIATQCIDGAASERSRHRKKREVRTSEQVSRSSH